MKGVEAEEELLRVMLDNLVRKGFIEVKEDVYHYIP